MEGDRLECRGILYASSIPTSFLMEITLFKPLWVLFSSKERDLQILIHPEFSYSSKIRKYLCVCVCVRDGAGGGRSALMYVCRDQGRTLSVLLYHFLLCCLETRSQTEPGAQWSLSLLPIALGLQVRMQPCPTFYTGAGHLNSGPRASTANAVTLWFIFVSQENILKLRD